MIYILYIYLRSPIRQHTVTSQSWLPNTQRASSGEQSELRPRRQWGHCDPTVSSAVLRARVLRSQSDEWSELHPRPNIFGPVTKLSSQSRHVIYPIQDTCRFVLVSQVTRNLVPRGFIFTYPAKSKITKALLIVLSPFALNKSLYSYPF